MHLFEYFFSIAETTKDNVKMFAEAIRAQKRQANRSDKVLYNYTY